MSNEQKSAGKKNTQVFTVELPDDVVYQFNSKLIESKFPFTDVEVVEIVKSKDNYKFSLKVTVKS